MNYSALPFPILVNGSTNGTITTVPAIFSLANDLTGNWLGIALLMLVWFVVFVSVNDAPIKRAAVASVFSLLASVAFYVIGIVQGWTVIFTTILNLAILYWLYRNY